MLDKEFARILQSFEIGAPFAVNGIDVNRKSTL